MATHTPGPWSVDVPYGETGVYVQANGDTSLVCRMLTGDKPDRLANARLIAAAPDLLAALEHLMRYDFGKSEGAELARAAIAKARGE